MTDEQLVAAISAAEDSAIGDAQGVISSDRADAIARYLGKDYAGSLAAPAGRSSVVSRDVSDVVQGVAANVLEPLVGGEQMVEFQPQGPEDEEAAQQETDYCNYVVMERNNGFVVLNTAVVDALLLRTGYIKCNWKVRTDVVSERYQGLGDEEMALLAQDKDVQVVEHSEYTDMMGATLHDVRVRRTKPTEYAETLPCPPDEVIVSQRARTPSLQDVDFVQHRTMQTLSELRQAGYEVEDDITDNESGETLEGYNRDRWAQSSGSLYDDPTQDMARRLVMFKESYIRIDKDGDGIAELRKVCQVGTTILADEECDIVPLVCFSAILMAHQHIGLSVYDLVQDLAAIKTALMRQYLDNKYLANNARMAVSTTSGVNIDDLLTSRPGGIIRGEGDPNTWLMPLVTPDTGRSALEGLEYLDSVRENRTGYTRLSQGLESDSLINKTMGGMQIQMSQSQLRLKMMTRTIVETGLRDLFRVVHALTCKHSTREDKVRLRNKWVSINPREWTRRTDLSISVGMGNAVPGMQMANLMAIAGLQEKAFPLGLVDPEKAFNLLKKVTASAGFKNEEEFFKPPTKAPKMGPDGQPVVGEDGQPVMEAQMPPPQPDPAVQVAQIKAQSDDKKTQATMQGEAQKFQAQTQTDAQKFQAEHTMKQQQIGMEAQAKERAQANELQVQQANDARQAQLDERQFQFDLVKLEKEYEFKVWEAQLKANNAVQVAQAGVAPEMKQKDNHAELLKHLAAPREIVRGPDGRVSGTRVAKETGAPQ